MFLPHSVFCKKSKTFLIKINGRLKHGISAKDVILSVIGQIGTAAGTGYAIEFGGSVIQDMSMEGRMTVCNMAIEAGARAGMIAVDDKTIDYLKDRPMSPVGRKWEAAEQYWRTLKSDENAVFDKVIQIEGGLIAPQVTWGTSPQMVTPVDGRVPNPQDEKNTISRKALENALDYMGLMPDTLITDIFG